MAAGYLPEPTPRESRARTARHFKSIAHRRARLSPRCQPARGRCFATRRNPDYERNINGYSCLFTDCCRRTDSPWHRWRPIGRYTDRPTTPTPPSWPRRCSTLRTSHDALFGNHHRRCWHDQQSARGVCAGGDKGYVTAAGRTVSPSCCGSQRADAADGSGPCSTY